jgi:hypothetical protein
MWDGNLFRFIVKHIHASQVGRPENCNMLIAHVQYIGPDSMASRYAYQISLFDTEHRRAGHKFEGLVTSTLKPLESQCAKEDVFVTTFHQARTYTDPWSNLNFIVRMKKLVDDDGSPQPSTSTSTTETLAPAAAVVNAPEPMDDSTSTPTAATDSSSTNVGVTAALPIPTINILSSAVSSSSH